MPGFMRKAYGDKLIYDRDVLKKDLEIAFQFFPFEYYLIIEIKNDKVSVAHNINDSDRAVLDWAIYALNSGEFGYEHLGKKEAIIVQIYWQESNTIGIDHPEGLLGYTRDTLRRVFSKHRLEKGIFVR